MAALPGLYMHVETVVFFCLRFVSANFESGDVRVLVVAGCYIEAVSAAMVPQDGEQPTGSNQRLDVELDFSKVLFKLPRSSVISLSLELLDPESVTATGEDTKCLC